MLHPSVAELAYMRTNVDEDRRPWFIGVNVVCLVLALVALGLRFTSRRRIGMKLGLDDWMVSAATALFTVYATSLLVMVRFGVGRHAVLITDRRQFAISSLVSQLLYNLGIGVVKFAILALYARIFRRTAGWFTPTLYATMLVVFLTAVPQCFAFLFQCVPIDSLWRDYGPALKVYCIDLCAAIVAFGVINIVTDWFIFILPIPMILGLQLDRRTKWSICSLFLFGGFVCVTSMVRLVYAKQADTSDPTWDYAPVLTISSLQMSAGILAACMPTLKPLFRPRRRAMPSYLSATDLSPEADTKTRFGNTTYIGRNRNCSRSRSRPRATSLKIDHGVLGTGMLKKKFERITSGDSLEKILKGQKRHRADYDLHDHDPAFDLDATPTSSPTMPAPASPPATQASGDDGAKSPPASSSSREKQREEEEKLPRRPLPFPPPAPAPSAFAHARDSLRHHRRHESLDRGRGRMRVVSADGLGRRVVSVGRGEDLGFQTARGRSSEGRGGGNGGAERSGWRGWESILVTRTVSRFSVEGEEAVLRTEMGRA